MKKIFITIAGIVAISALAQQPDTNVFDDLKALSKMEGNWSGGGWTITPERKRVTFTQHEEIKYELNGTILQIRGKGFNEDGEIIHDALGIIYYEPERNKYLMDAFLASGQHTLAEIEITPSGMNWSFRTEQGATISYEIEIIDDTWTEKGYYSPDGVKKFPFIEFSLTRNTKSIEK